MFFYMSIVNHFCIIGVFLYHVISVSFCRYTQPDKHFETSLLSTSVTPSLPFSLSLSCLFVLLR